MFSFMTMFALFPLQARSVSATITPLWCSLLGKWYVPRNGLLHQQRGALNKDIGG